MAWMEVGFGKHRGKTLPQIVLTDPDWFFWAVGENVFKSILLRSQASEIFRKASRIKIPRGAGKEVEYTIHPGVGKLANVTIVPADRPRHAGASATHRTEYFDLSVPRKIAPYDKTGGKIIVDAIKRYIFGSADTRLTRARCEQFFDDDANFA